MEKLANCSRVIKVTYRQIPLEIQVQSWHEELVMKTECFLKDKAARAGIIELLDMEGEIYGGSVAKAEDVRAFKLAPSIHIEWGSARGIFNQMVNVQKLKGERIINLLSVKKDALLTIDRTFAVEVAFITALHTTAGLQLIHERILAVLPATPGQCTLDSCIQQLGTMAESALFDIINTEGKAHLDSIRETLKNLARGIAPLPPTCSRTPR